ncbi:Piso0_001830 [Millerozyma farinosa CBS 7064]|uniref:Piso0_001830 protein n=1 Tax=Pichia sorbitophila (strain ATCC MYA-4447 / BCRC 22081 / CBS 7064 / NBRC 10061 / NRRL Y-12695) TaxID=559304 RepID=G8YP75_PICSO|nr:Piso0_001830 [Millerozyma farinosa CBS 7064]
METKHRFLILNPAEDNLEEIISKANAQNKKNGPFEAVILLGDVVTEASKLSVSAADVPIYFSYGTKKSSSMAGSERANKVIEVSDNLFYFDSYFHIEELPSGITLGFVSGEELDDEKLQNIKETFQGRKIDILVTYKWPHAIARLQKLLLVESKTVDSIVEASRPRYHFAVGTDKGRFFECKPFSWDGNNVRFISLGKQNTDNKWFYAFAMPTVANKVDQVDTIENPFLLKDIQPINAPEENNTTNKRQLDDSNTAQENTVKKVKVVPPDKCFFCLSNPNVEIHMVISIGKTSYMTIAKGPLSRPSSGLTFSGHVLIIPIEHLPSLRSKYSKVEDSEVFGEMSMYESTVACMFSEKSDLRMITFEVNRDSNVHHHIQMVPVHKSALSSFPKALEEKVQGNNEIFTKNHKLEFKKYTDRNSPEIIDITNNHDFILFTVHMDDRKEYWIAKLHDKSKTVDLQFPRRVLSLVLRSPKRIHWEKCQQTRFREIQECEEFQKVYRDYDFTEKS